MGLQFNEPVIKRDKYVLFPAEKNGRVIDEMPKLLADNRYPLSAAEFKKLRLRAFDIYASVLENPNQYAPKYRAKVAKFFKDVWSNYVYTGDAVFRRPNGKAKIILVNPQTAHGSKFLKLINPTNKKDLKMGAIVLPNGMYNSANDIHEFGKVEMGRFTGKMYFEEDALDNRIWRVLARNPDEVPKELAEDPALLRNYVRAVNYLAYLAFRYDKNMVVYVSNPRDVEIGRLWFVGGLLHGSVASGREFLDNANDRLVGVAPEAPRLAIPSTERLEEIIAKLKPHEREVKQLLIA